MENQFPNSSPACHGIIRTKAGLTVPGLALSQSKRAAKCSPAMTPRFRESRRQNRRCYVHPIVHFRRESCSSVATPLATNKIEALSISNSHIRIENLMIPRGRRISPTPSAVTVSRTTPAIRDCRHSCRFPSSVLPLHRLRDVSRSSLLRVFIISVYPRPSAVSFQIFASLCLCGSSIISCCSSVTLLLVVKNM